MCWERERERERERCIYLFLPQGRVLPLSKIVEFTWLQGESVRHKGLKYLAKQLLCRHCLVNPKTNQLLFLYLTRPYSQIVAKGGKRNRPCIDVLLVIKLQAALLMTLYWLGYNKCYQLKYYIYCRFVPYV